MSEEEQIKLDIEVPEIEDEDGEEAGGNKSSHVLNETGFVVTENGSVVTVEESKRWDRQK